jgi:hypothetical protein
MRPRFGVVLVSALVLAAGMIAAMTAPASPASRASGQVRAAADPGEGVPGFGHVFLIIGENTTYSHLSRLLTDDWLARSAPYPQLDISICKQVVTER